MIKKYYCLKLKLVSGMNVGNGENYLSDKDILRNSLGKPFIPGSAMAGAYRSLFDKEDQSKYFGPELDRDKLGQKEYSAVLRSSKVLVYDAVPDKDSVIRISRRDCVGLDQYKTAIDRAKFDFEILEPGVTFTSFIEQNLEFGSEKDIGSSIVRTVADDGLYIGGKTKRGLGHLVLEADKDCPFSFGEHIPVKMASFNLNDSRQLESWLSFNMYDESDSNWSAMPLVKQKSIASPCRILLKLKQKGGISIRSYTTAVNTEEKPEPDYEQLYYKQGDLDAPVIPGTSWAGSFRHHMEQLGVGKAALDQAFGCIGAQKHASRIRFSESILIGTTSKTITRNAIDRFTAGTVGGALYTERSRFYGHTQLEICLEKGIDQSVLNALSISIVDLHLGFLAIGGLTAVGRGLFELSECSVNGTSVAIEEPEKIYKALLDEICVKEEECSHAG